MRLIIETFTDDKLNKNKVANNLFIDVFTLLVRKLDTATLYE